MNMERFEQIGDRSTCDSSSIRIKKVGKERQIFGNVTISADLDNSYLLTGQLYVKQGNEYRKSAYRIPETKFCDFLADDEYGMIKEFFEASNRKYPPECPFKKVSERFTQIKHF
jgi:hypothetical protein